MKASLGIVLHLVELSELNNYLFQYLSAQLHSAVRAFITF